ncbi:MAG: hypothetical protein Crog4KO_28630 [Crocinitomicaceae bacterium]
MKVYFYIFSWLITLVVGIIVGAPITNEVELSFAFAAVAAVLSAPFMAIFCIVMFIYLKKKPSKTQLHLRTLLLHAIGSILTVLLFTLATNEILPTELYLAIFGYFLIDSICFHSFIQARHTNVEEIKKSSEDILDSPLDSTT